MKRKFRFIAAAFILGSATIAFVSSLTVSDQKVNGALAAGGIVAAIAVLWALTVLIDKFTE